MKCEEDNGDTTVGQEIQDSNDDTSGNGMTQFFSLLVFFHLLEVELWQHVQVIWELNDEVKFVQECHGMVRVVSPQARHILSVLLTNNDLSSPQERH